MRADVYLFTYEYTKSRQSARVLIDGGKILIDGVKVAKPSQEIDENIEHMIEIIDRPQFVSRGGEKLEAALQCFGIDVAGLDCIDVGASTGGFTDCLLQRGAASVYAVDSGHSQLDIKLSNDPRVISIEKFNAKRMQADDFPHQFDLAVMDVSFISQTMIHPSVSQVLKNDGAFVALIKPQFECGRSALNSKGVVKNSAYHHIAVVKVIESALLNGFSCLNIMRSPIEGGSGNIEFLAYFMKSDVPVNLVSQESIKRITQAK